MRNLLALLLVTAATVTSLGEGAYRDKIDINIGAILPDTALTTTKRTYQKIILTTVKEIVSKRRFPFNFTERYNLKQANVVYMRLAPSPSHILDILCTQLLPKNVVTVLYFTNSPVYGNNVASTQYVMQLIGYLGIPIIAWNADNIGLEQRVSDSRILQLAPSVEHQAAALLAILKRYNWKQFSVVTSELGGHDDFIRAIRDLVLASEPNRYFIMDILTLKASEINQTNAGLDELANSEARIILLYCSREEASKILGAGRRLGITTKNYIWIVTQSVLGSGESNHKAPKEFPPGMLGIRFNSTKEKLYEALENAILLFAHGLEIYTNDVMNGLINHTLSPRVDCNVTNGGGIWREGELLSKYLRNVSFSGKNIKQPIEFHSDGTLKHVELEVVNLRDENWDKIGSWDPSGIDIKDIVWPGDSPVPPRGVPEKFNLKVTFMEEPPYMNTMLPNNVTGECQASRAVRCRIIPEAQLVGLNLTEAYKNPKYFRCCTGFCIDLLQQFANDLGFTYDLHRVEDGTWGVQSANGTWNGLIAALLNHKADLVVTSIKINSGRQQAVDFTVPFLETGIAIVVAKRTGIISPKAFLEPFDTLSWLMILLVSIHAAAFIIFFFEWLSPAGLDMKSKAPKDHRFSLCRANWLVWTLLFGAAVNVDCPRGFTARFMSNVWGFFSVIFLAIYTANLATFMITREEFYELTGIEDKLLQNPYLVDPAFRFGTIPFGNTEAVLRDNKPEMYAYMKRFNRSTVDEGIAAVKERSLDAFIYDATVLEYRVGQDHDCRLLTVGSWYAMTGYGFALRKNSKYLGMFNKMMIEYRENGDLERLRSFWLQGACKPKQDKRNASHPLDVNQFMSAFLLLGCGILLTGLLLGLEHFYFQYIGRLLAKTDKVGCCSLVSRNMGAHKASLEMIDSKGKDDDTAGGEDKPISTISKSVSSGGRRGCTCETCDLALKIITKELELARKQTVELEKELESRIPITGIGLLKEKKRKKCAAGGKKTPPQLLSPATDGDTFIAEIETAL